VQLNNDKIHRARPIRGKVYVDSYIKAFYYGEDDVNPPPPSLPLVFLIVVWTHRLPHVRRSVGQVDLAKLGALPRKHPKSLCAERMITESARQENHMVALVTSGVGAKMRSKQRNELVSQVRSLYASQDSSTIGY
jgi:hypothetical protein